MDSKTTRRLTVTIGASGNSEPIAINNATVVGLGVDWPAAVSAGSLQLEFIPSNDYAGTGALAVGPFEANSTLHFDADAVVVAGSFARVRRTVNFTGGTPTIYVFIQQ